MLVSIYHMRIKNTFESRFWRTKHLSQYMGKEIEKEMRISLTLVFGKRDFSYQILSLPKIVFMKQCAPNHLLLDKDGAHFNTRAI